jgi:hypothetical protein
MNPGYDTEIEMGKEYRDVVPVASFCSRDRNW